MTILKRRATTIGIGVLLCAPAIAAAQQTDVVTYFHTDAIGSVRMTTDANGQVLQRHDYLPFGEEWQATALPSEVRLFAGKERDQTTGFDYFGGRYYASGSGRFTTVDPALDVAAALTNPQRWNRYAYVSGNPVAKVDPSGRYEVDVHLYLTTALAQAAGVSRSVAERIGASDYGVDGDPARGPYADRFARRDFHFTDAQRRMQLWDEFQAGGTPEQLGVFFHAEQDAYAHEGFGPRMGHLFAGHRPDQTFAAPLKADAMARDTYERLVAAAARLGGPTRTAVPWEKVSPFVARFNRARDVDEKRRILDEMLQALDSARD